MPLPDQYQYQETGVKLVLGSMETSIEASKKSPWFLNHQQRKTISVAYCLQNILVDVGALGELVPQYSQPILELEFSYSIKRDKEIKILFKIVTVSYVVHGGTVIL